MRSLLLWCLQAQLISKSVNIITLPPFSFPFWKNIPIISIPTTEEGNLERRYLGMPKFKDSGDFERWWEQEEPKYKKFVTEQILKEEEEFEKRGLRTTRCSEEILKSYGEWEHYYDYKTKEIERFDKKNPPELGRMTMLESYKRLKAIVQYRQRLEEEGIVTELSSGLIREKEKLRKWVEEEEKAGRLKCECENHTSTRFTERYTFPEDQHYHAGMFSKEK